MVRLLLVLVLEVVLILMLLWLWLEVVVLLLWLGLFLRRRTEDRGLCLRPGVAWDGGENRRLGASVRGVPLGRIKGARNALRSTNNQGHILDGSAHYVVRAAWLRLVDCSASVEWRCRRLPTGTGERVMLLLRDGALV